MLACRRVHKVFVLDTNVLLHDPRAIFKFDEHEVVLPIYVIEEVDHFKRDMNELGRNARMLSRFIDELREEAKDNLQGGVTLPSGGRLRVAVPSDVLAEMAAVCADLLVRHRSEGVRECENPDCSLWFVDGKRGPRRRWCSMAVCGNRMKIAAHRARQRSGAGGSGAPVND